jgi:hypothetical protein
MRVVARSVTAFCLLCVFCASTHAAQESSAQTQRAADSLVLPAEIRATLAALPQDSNPAPLLTRVRSGYTAASETRSSDAHYQRLGDGLVGITTILSGKDAILTRVLTLAGLIELVSTSESAVEINTNLTLPIGRAFLPFEIRQTSHASSVRNTTGLSGDLASLVYPKPGTSFSYVQKWNAQVTSSTGAFSSKKTVAGEFKVSCVAKESLDAAMLHEGFKGKYLPVTCTGSNQQGAIFTDEFAYLLDSQIYLRLSGSNKFGRTEYKFSGAEYQ